MVIVKNIKSNQYKITICVGGFGTSPQLDIPRISNRWHYVAVHLSLYKLFIESDGLNGSLGQMFKVHTLWRRTGQESFILIT